MASYLDTQLLQLWQPFLLQLLSQLPAAEVSKVCQEGHRHHTAVSWLQAQLHNNLSGQQHAISRVAPNCTLRAASRRVAGGQFRLQWWPHQFIKQTEHQEPIKAL